MSILAQRTGLAPLTCKQRSKCPLITSISGAPLVLRPLYPSAASPTSCPQGVAAAVRHRQPSLRCCATAAAASDSNDKSELFQTLFLGSLFASWYVANIVFNIYNKQVLKAFPFPMTLTEVQFLVGSAATLFCWGSGILKVPRITMTTVLNVLPLAIVHTLGNLLTNMSLGAVAVSFTHTIKAMEPFFSVVLSAIFLGDTPSPLVVATLIPIIGGVAMASMTEASFNWVGFMSAMGSNLTFQSRNVLSKKLMLKKDSQGAGRGGLDNISLFCCITLMSALLLLPVTLLLEGWKMSPAGLAALGVQNPNQVLQGALMAGLCFHAYQQVSYMILQRVSPVTHSIGNCVKRVVVIAASVVVFRNPVSLQNALGTAVALVGVFAYGQVKRMQSGGKAKASAE